MKTRVVFAVLGSLAFAACGSTGSGVTPSSEALGVSSASASNPLKASVSSLNLTSTTNPVTFIVSETGYKGAFTASGCTSIVALSPKAGKGPKQQFAAKVVKAGKCTLKISDRKHSVPISVTATTTTGVIQ